MHSLFRGFTALHRSSIQGYLDICHFLVEQKADVNANISYVARPHTRTRIRWRILASIVFTFSLFRSHTPLHLASHGGHIDICQFLVEHKADVNAEDDEYNFPSFYAQSKYWRHSIRAFSPSLSPGQTLPFTMLPLKATPMSVNISSRRKPTLPRETSASDAALYIRPLLTYCLAAPATHHSKSPSESRTVAL
jgi:hypothetical protein